MATIWDEMRRMQQEMDSLFDGFFGRTSPERQLLPGKTDTSLQAYKRPLVDVYETDNEVVVSAELPGVNKDDIKINITDDSVELKAETKHETKVEDKKKGFYRFERSHSGFYRKMPLPEGAIPDKAEASYKDGVLELKMPKAEEKKKGREIKIK